MPIAFYTLLIELVSKGEIYLAAKPRVIPVASVGAINHRSEECGDPEARKDRVVEINFASNDQIARRPVEPSQQILASSNERRVLASIRPMEFDVGMNEVLSGFVCLPNAYVGDNVTRAAGRIFGP